MLERKVNTVAGLAKLLMTSGLASAEETSQLLEQFRELNRDDAQALECVTDLTSFLISSGTLTAWQVEKLRHGQWKGFFLAGHRVLDIVGHDEDRTFCLARNVETGTIVRLAVKPDFTTEILPR